MTFTLKDSSGNTVPGTVSFDSDEHGGHVHAVGRAGQRRDLYTVSVSGAHGSIRPDDAPYTATFITSRRTRRRARARARSGPMSRRQGLPMRPTRGRWSWASGSRLPATGRSRAYGSTRMPDNTGNPYGHAVEPNGTMLATGTFTNESTQGWEELDFPSR